jgi:hypothetical protein
LVIRFLASLLIAVEFKEKLQLSNQPILLLLSVQVLLEDELVANLGQTSGRPFAASPSAR